MKTSTSEFPKHPLPHVPLPQEPQHPKAQQPTVFVYEKQDWEYRVVTKKPAGEAVLIEGELNALGKDGWELVGIVSLSEAVHFYLKRVRS